MNGLEIIQEIRKKGSVEFYYRFVMVLPRKFLGKGRTFDGISGKGDEFDKTTSWYREDCLLPIAYITGVEVLSTSYGMVTLSLLVDEEDLKHFGREMGRNLTDLDLDVKIEEFKHDG